MSFQRAPMYYWGYYMAGKSYNKILIATDGSDNAKNAIFSGMNLAGLLGAKIYAVCVLPTHPASSMPIGSRMMRWEIPFDIMREEGTKAVNEVVELAKINGVDAEPVLLEGHPSEEILRYAQDNDIDLIVMGTLGKTGLTRLLLGSVAENVLRHSPVEVLVVR